MSLELLGPFLPPCGVSQPEAEVNTKKQRLRDGANKSMQNLDPVTPDSWQVSQSPPFPLKPGRAEFFSLPTKKVRAACYRVRILCSLGTPEFPPQWWHLSRTPSVHQGGQEKCLEWTRTHQKARSNSLHHHPLPPSSLLSALPIKIACVCPSRLYENSPKTHNT